MKVVLSITLFCIINLAMSQRSPYAPRPVGYPSTLEHYNTNSNTNANAGDTNDPNNLPNRFGGDPDDKGPRQPEPGVVGDPYLVQRLPEWPREHQPFWYLNREHIKTHQNQPMPGTQSAGTQQGGSNLGTRLGEDSSSGSIMLGSQVHTSSFVKRPVERPGLGAQFANNNGRQF